MSELNLVTGYLADPTGVSDSTTPLNNWWAAIVAARSPGRIPEGTYKVTAALTFDLQGLGAGGVRIISDNAIINGTAVNGVVLTIQRSGGTSGSPALTEHFRIEGALTVQGNSANRVVQIGKADYSDRFSALTIEHLVVTNASNNANAGGIRVGLVDAGSELWLSGTTTGGSASVGAVEITKLSNSRLAGAGQASGASAASLLISEAATGNQVGEFAYGTSAAGLSITSASAANNLFIAPDFTGNANPVNAPQAYAGNTIVAPKGLSGPLTGGISIIGRGSLTRYSAPSASSYTAAGADDGLILSSANATGPAAGWAAASLPVTLPDPATVGAGWSMGFVTNTSKAVVLTTPGSIKLLAGGQQLATLTLGPGNFEFVALVSDGTNFRLSSVSPETARTSGIAPPGLPSRWIYPPGPGYQLTQGDNGAVVSSAVVSAALALTLPSTTAIVSGWTVTLLRDGHTINLAVNGSSGGSIITSAGTSASNLSLTYYSALTLQFDGANFRVVTPDAMARDGSNVILPDALYNLGLQLPASADGVLSPTSGATVSAGGNVVTVSGGSFTAADVGKYFTMKRGGSSVYFAGATIVAAGTGYHAGGVISVSGAQANIWTVTAVSAALVSGGTGGPLNATFIVKGLTSGRRSRRDSARLTVTTNGSGVVTSIVSVAKGGAYTNPAFTGIAESFDSKDYPGLTGLTVDLTLGVGEIRRKAASFYGRITGTTLTVEEVGYGTISLNDTLAGIEVTEGTTITALGTGTGGLGTYTISNSHSGMDQNVWLFVSETPSTTNTPPAGNVSPTGGTGTGLSITPLWRGTPISSTIAAVLSTTQIRLAASAISDASNVGYCYGTDYGTVIQAAIDAGHDVFLPRGVICHANQLTYKNNTRIIGAGHALGNSANTILAYVGSNQSRGKQLSADEDVTGTVDGATIGNLMLWGNNLIGIGYFQRGVFGSQILPISIRSHTYIGVQLAGSNDKANVANVHSTFIVREIDSPGFDTTGVYFGPGVAQADPSVSVWDTCRTLYPYFQVDIDLQGFGRPIWYRTADSNSHEFVKTRGPADLPGIEFASHDSKTYYARAIHFSYLDPNSVRLRGGAYPAAVVVSFYNFLNGGVAADVDGTADAGETSSDELGVTTELGARFFCVSNIGTLTAPRLQPFNFSNLQSPAASDWMLLPITNANTDVPGAQITGTGSKSVLAYTDGSEVLRVLAPQSAIARPTLLSTSSFTASYGAGTNLIRAAIPSGNLLYMVSSVPSGDTVVHVVDFSDPTLPVEISETNIGAGNASGSVVLAGSYLFIAVADATTSIRIVDISNPKTPVLTATIATGNGGAGGLAVSGNILYAGTRTGGIFRAYDLGGLPGVPPQIGTLSLTSVTLICNILVKGKFAYVTEDNATDTNLGLQIIDISNPASPALVGSYDASRGSAGDYDVRGIAVSGGYAFLTVFDGTSGALHVVDVSNPASPTVALNGITPVVLALSSPANTPGQNPIFLSGDVLYVVGTGGASGVQRYNVAKPLVPALIENIALSGGVLASISGNLLFAAKNATTNNLLIYQLVGWDLETLAVGSLRVDRARIEHLDLDRDLRIGGSLNLGGSIQSRGPIRSEVELGGSGALLKKLASDPATAPGAGLIRLYVVEGASGKATLRAQAGTSTTSVDLAVDIGSGF